MYSLAVGALAVLALFAFIEAPSPLTVAASVVTTFALGVSTAVAFLDR